MIGVSSRWNDREEEIRHRLRSYSALRSKHAACLELYNSHFPRSTARITDEPRGGQMALTEMESVVQQRMDLSDIMARSLADMQNELRAITDMLKPLPADEYTVLLRRYTLGERWEEIAVKLNYCERQVWRIHDKGIRRLGDGT